MEAKGKFMVTPAGRAWLDEQYPNAFAELRANPDATAAYERFERINRDLLTLFTDWQMVPAAGGRTPNDHADADYDRRVIDDLSALHTLAEAMLEQLAQGQVRFADYNLRLADALMRLRAGDNRAFATPMSASYHCIWMELHEDLLVTLGRERDEADGN